MAFLYTRIAAGEFIVASRYDPDGSVRKELSSLKNEADRLKKTLTGETATEVPQAPHRSPLQPTAGTSPAPRVNATSTEPVGRVVRTGLGAAARTHEKRMPRRFKAAHGGAQHTVNPTRPLSTDRGVVSTYLDKSLPT